MTTQIRNYINDAPAPGTEISYVPEEVVALGLSGTEKQIAYARDLIANYYRAIEFTAYNIYSHRDGKVLKRVKKDGTVLISRNTKDYTESDLLELRKYITYQIINNEKLHDASIIIDKFRRKCEDSARSEAKDIHLSGAVFSAEHGCMVNSETSEPVAPVWNVGQISTKFD